MYQIYQILLAKFIPDGIPEENIFMNIYNNDESFERSHAGRML
jgi:hypothetical protein